MGRRNLQKGIYLLVIVAAVVFVSFFGGPLPYLLLYTVILVPVFSVLYLLYVSQVLRLHQELPGHHVKKGEGSPYRLILENTGPLPVVCVSLLPERDLCEISDFPKEWTLSLSPGQRVEFTSELVCRYAGTYEIGVKRLQIRDCFRLFDYTFPAPVSFRAIVRPQITDQAAQLLRFEGQRSRIEIRNPYFFADTLGGELRDYQRGDRLNQIHWKNSARQHRLLVRKPEPMEMQQVQVVMIPAGRTETLEEIARRDQFLELAVSVADYFCRQKKAVHFYYPDGEIKRQTVDSYDRFLEFYSDLPDRVKHSDWTKERWGDWLCRHCGEQDSLTLLLKEQDLTLTRFESGE